MAGLLYVVIAFKLSFFSFSDRVSSWKKNVAKPVGLLLSRISGSVPVVFSPNLIPMLACNFHVQRDVCEDRFVFESV